MKIKCGNDGLTKDAKRCFDCKRSVVSIKSGKIKIECEKIWMCD